MASWLCQPATGSAANAAPTDLFAPIDSVQVSALVLQSPDQPENR